MYYDWLALHVTEYASVNWSYLSRSISGNKREILSSRYFAQTCSCTSQRFLHQRYQPSLNNSWIFNTLFPAPETTQRL